MVEKDELINRVRTQMIGKMDDIEPEQRTEEAATFVFREVLGYRLGYARGLGEMIISESTSKHERERDKHYAKEVKRHEKEVEYYKSQFEELRGDVKSTFGEAVYLYWLLVAALYHLSPQPRDNFYDMSVFLTTFASSVLRLLVFLFIYDRLAYFFKLEAPKWNLGNIFKHSAYSLLWLDPVYERYNSYRGTATAHDLAARYPFLARYAVKTSADLYKTVFDLLVSVNIFLGRFDLRIMQAVTSQVQDGAREHNRGARDQQNLLYDFSKKDELWFDFMADTGDGGNSAYTVTRLLAKRAIRCNGTNGTKLTLKRGDLLLIGGDLAYPNPSKYTYERRFLRPFEYALQLPNNHKRDHGHVGPQCFVIPGNHDWFDGLQTFTKYICEKKWLGGWYMPQKTSYFAVKLPQRWWIFGLDLALDGDIDTYQFQFFSNLAREKIGKNDAVIVMTHQPDWLVDWYETGTDVERDNLSELICNILKERCKLRIAGDIHHYMRHSMVPESNDLVYAQHLLVNGCGGAFLHPTHVFGDFKESHGVSYQCGASYPDKETSRRLGFRNIWKFRKENSQFDFVGGIMYYMLVFSMIPQCELDHVFEVDSKLGFWRTCFRTLWNAFIYMLEHSYVSLGAAMMLVVVAMAFTPSKVSWKKRVAIGILHVSAHLSAALILMLVLELGVGVLVHHKLLGTSGYHSLYRWYESQEKSRNFGLSNGTRAGIEQWSSDLYSTYVKNLMFAFDVPELMAVTRINICKNGIASLARLDTIFYYGSVFLYFWLLSTPAVSYVFGIYLYICVNWLDLHYDEAFSSLRIADYKAFTRFHIDSNGDLHVYTLAVDKVPLDWNLDRRWMTEQNEHPNKLSYNRDFPSQWEAADPDKDPLSTVRIIDEFVIQRSNTSWIRRNSPPGESLFTKLYSLLHHITKT
ncbi:uncharacterized protein LOC121244175 [Juglans microcarpa x Juglans regia]|uniref:uncharacterized protein LOC121244175 n=1 Tax=Juglans microcarpa x Juglans regia TaxID=2249226 RepID=UPI001B7E7285|nr:uncharacterized protein LOC121244175 [Juglans microcarpa x Juglans regia]